MLKPQLIFFIIIEWVVEVRRKEEGGPSLTEGEKKAFLEGDSSFLMLGQAFALLCITTYLNLQENVLPQVRDTRYLI
jgi:hypothetical protein